MEKLNAKNYDLLWKWGVPYLFMSIYLESGYKKIDAISYNEGDTNYLFLAKKERATLSKKGLLLFTHDFKNFQAKIKKATIRTKKYLKSNKHVDVKKISNGQLLEEFITMTNFLRDAWTVYFPTEVHHMDLINVQIKNNKRGLQKNLKQLAQLRQRFRKEIINEIIYAPGPYDRYTKEISRRLKQDITNFDYRQIIALLQGKKEKKSFDGMVLLGKFNGWNRITGTKAKKIFDQLLPIAETTNELRGVTGNRGYYKGRARVIHFDLKTDFQKEINAMKKGEILISGSTGPEMILACKKAGAIVTEEGGMLSHAAIVSRELGIPCVIATKIATKIIKTGDWIEVDATKGIVKINQPT